MAIIQIHTNGYLRLEKAYIKLTIEMKLKVDTRFPNPKLEY